jgi:hypothetical protein
MDLTKVTNFTGQNLFLVGCRGYYRHRLDAVENRDDPVVDV